MILNRSSFKKWLESKPVDECVGQPGAPKDCPIAKWLQSSDESGLGLIGFNASGVYRKMSSSSPFARLSIIAPAPIWAVQFIKRIDSLKPSDRILAWDALAILNERKELESDG